MGLLSLLQDKKGITPDQQQLIVRHFEEILHENKRQNLTRLTDPKQFFEAQLQDCFELVSSRWIQYPALDLGSGSGVPGIPLAILTGETWILAESEKLKAKFLNKFVEKTSLKNVRIFSGRGEEYLKDHSVGSVLTKAVASPEKIYSWIRNCSTWNNWILFLGPQSVKAWSTFLKTKKGLELKVEYSRDYSIDGGRIERRLVSVVRNKPILNS